MHTGTPDNTERAERSDVGEVFREAVSHQLEVPSVPMYEVADLELEGSEVADWVTEVVQVESPVHVQEVSRRITRAASIKRTGSRIRAAIESGCDKAARQGRVRRSGEFLWRPDMQEAPLRDRSRLPDASKKLEFIAPEEIAAAIERVVADSFGIDKSEIPAAVLRLLLGFRRTTERAQELVTEVLDGMVAEGRLTEEGDQVSLKG